MIDKETQKLTIKIVEDKVLTGLKGFPEENGVRRVYPRVHPPIEFGWGWKHENVLTGGVVKLDLGFSRPGNWLPGVITQLYLKVSQADQPDKWLGFNYWSRWRREAVFREALLSGRLTTELLEVLPEAWQEALEMASEFPDVVDQIERAKLAAYYR